MRVHANASPSGAFRIEDQPNMEGYASVRFYENAQEVEAQKHWEYDEYTLIVPKTPSLTAEIEENYAVWLETAKSYDAEYPAKVARDEAEQTISALDEAIIELEYKSIMNELGMEE